MERFLKALVDSLPIYAIGVWALVVGACLFRAVFGPTRRRALVILVGVSVATLIHVEGLYHFKRFHTEQALPAPLCHVQSGVHERGNYRTHPFESDPLSLASAAGELQKEDGAVEEELDVGSKLGSDLREARTEQIWEEDRTGQIQSVTFPLLGMVAMLTLLSLWLFVPPHRDARNAG